MSKALLIVDVQYDFLQGGALAVKEGHQIIFPLVDLAKEADLVVATRDWHPYDHCSFSNEPDFKTTFPRHCLQNHPAADLHYRIARISDVIVNKGMNKDKEAFSGFANPSLISILDPFEEIMVGGLATDFCVLATVRDALELGLNVTVYKDATRGIKPDCSDDLAEIQLLGAKIL